MNIIKLLLTIILSFCSIASINAADKLKVLLLGSSFGQDSWQYMPWLLKNIYPDCDLTVGEAYYGGCTLDKHTSIINAIKKGGKGARYQQFYIYHNGSTSWHCIDNPSADMILSYEKWDIIFIMCASTDLSQFYYSKDNIDKKTNDFIAKVNTLIDAVSNHIDHEALFGWNMITSSPGATKTPESGQQNPCQEIFECFAELSAKIQKETKISIVNPYGTAIYNLRNTDRKSIGRYKILDKEPEPTQEGYIYNGNITIPYVPALAYTKNKMWCITEENSNGTYNAYFKGANASSLYGGYCTVDGTHLMSGLPMYTANLSTALTLLKYLGFEEECIEKELTTVKPGWENWHNVTSAATQIAKANSAIVPAYTSDPYEDRRIARRCVLAAFQKPFLHATEEPNGIRDIQSDNATIEKIYTIDGRTVNSVRGINIIKMSDGTTKKVWNP